MGLRRVSPAPRRRLPQAEKEPDAVARRGAEQAAGLVGQRVLEAEDARARGARPHLPSDLYQMERHFERVIVFVFKNVSAEFQQMFQNS